MRLEVDEKLAPALRPHGPPALEANEFLPATGGCVRPDPHARAARAQLFHTYLTPTQGQGPMAMLEDVKKIAEKVTGWSRPKPSALRRLIRERKSSTFRFKDDGIVPNHPQGPLVIYRGAVRLPDDLDPAAVFEELFKSDGWGDSWRDGVYDYVHYHSRNEALGIASGEGKVQFGGHRGRVLRLKAGDVAVPPAGTGHQCLGASDDLLVVGAYPPSGTYDELQKQQRPQACSEDHFQSRATAERPGPCGVVVGLASPGAMK